MWMRTSLVENPSNQKAGKHKKQIHTSPAEMSRAPENHLKSTSGLRNNRNMNPEDKQYCQTSNAIKHRDSRSRCSVVCCGCFHGHHLSEECAALLQGTVATLKQSMNAR